MVVGRFDKKHGIMSKSVILEATAEQCSLLVQHFVLGLQISNLTRSFTTLKAAEDEYYAKSMY